MHAALVIMAAGIGSRYGGSKQTDGVGPHGEILMEYGVYDAVRAGFDKVVFIIKPDMLELMKRLCGDMASRLRTPEGQPVEVCYAFQDFSSVPAFYRIPEGRTKPFGTTHAVLCTREFVHEPFCVINADDYYGKEGLKKVHEYLCNPAKSDKKFNFCMAGFEVGNTLSDNGTVTRGICQVKDGILTKIVETKEIGRGDNCATTPDGNVPLNQPVSMNMWGLTPDIFPELEKRFVTFLGSIEGNEMKAEYLIPTIIGDMVEEGLADVHVLPTSDKWFGVTYKEDKQVVVDSIRELIAKGIYKDELFS